MSAAARSVQASNRDCSAATSASSSTTSSATSVQSNGTAPRPVDGQLVHVFHQDDGVNGSFEVADASFRRLRRFVHLARRVLIHLGDTVLRSPEQHHVARFEARFPLGVEQPVPLPADRQRAEPVSLRAL